MPTIVIHGPERPARERRATAVRLTRWLANRGVASSHVVVRFETLPPGSLYVGGMAVEWADGAGPLHHAAVTCEIHPDRDEAFRDQLAAEIADTLGARQRTAFFMLEFRPTDPRHVYVAKAGRLGPADGDRAQREEASREA